MLACKHKARNRARNIAQGWSTGIGVKYKTHSSSFNVSLHFSCCGFVLFWDRYSLCCLGRSYTSELRQTSYCVPLVTGTTGMPPSLTTTEMQWHEGTFWGSLNLFKPAGLGVRRWMSFLLLPDLLTMKYHVHREVNRGNDKNLSQNPNFTSLKEMISKCWRN